MMIISLSLTFILSSILTTHADDSECGRVKIKPAIYLAYNGTLSYHGQFPWLAPLFHTRKGYLCGSSIITQWHLLTAAHCVISNAREYYALMGRFDLTNSHEVNWIHRNISDIYIHDDYDEANSETQRSKGDIAIFRVSREIRYSDYVQPVCLPQPLTNVIGVNGLVSGYGKTEIYGNYQSTPSYVLLTSISTWECLNKGLVYGNIVSENGFCAGNDQAVPCQGDSGGGFHVIDKTTRQHTIYGIVSVAIGLCDPKDYVAFADVPKYIPWIREKLQHDNSLINSLDPCDTIDCGFNSKCEIFSQKAQCSCLANIPGSSPYCGARCLTNTQCSYDRACLNNFCVDLCIESALNCVQNAHCEMKNHQQECICKKGYQGSGFSECSVDPNFIDGYQKEENFCDNFYEEQDCQFDNGFIVNITNKVTSENSELRPSHHDDRIKVLVVNKNRSNGNFFNYLPINVDENFPNLRKYNIRSQSLREINRENFRHLKSLEVLDIRENHVELNVRANSFDDLSELRYLLLAENKIKVLDEDLLRFNRKLEKIFLYFNLIVSLKSNFFQNLIELRELNLYGNQLTSLPEDIFVKLYKLEQLDLSENKLQELPQKIFQNLKELTKIELSFNEIAEISQNLFVNCPKLKFIDASYNEITQLHENAFINNRKVENIHLKNNRLVTLSAKQFENLSELKKVDLSDNHLATLPQNIFEKNYKLETIALASNRMTSLSWMIAENKAYLRNVDLKSNICIDSNFGFVYYVMKREERESMKQKLAKNC